MHTDIEEPVLPPLRDPLFAPLRGELGLHDTPPGVRKELLAAFARQHARRHWWQRLGALSGAGWGLLGCGVIGVMALGLLLVVMLRAPVPDQQETLAGWFDHDATFIALDTLERIEQEPAPRTLATMVPRTALASLGVAVSPENAGDMVMAEMLVGADGSPLALRLASQ